MKSPASESPIEKGQIDAFDVVDGLIETVSDQQHRLLLKVLLHSGIYLSELVELQSKDINFKDAVVRIGSRFSRMRKRRSIGISPDLAAQLERFFDPRKPYLFYTPFAPKLNPRYVQRVLLRCSRQWGMKLSPKKLQRLYRSRAFKEKKGGSSFGLRRFDDKKSVADDNLSLVLSKTKDTRTSLIIEILLETGCFASELLLIQRAHIDILQNQITMPGKRSRIIDISPKLSASLYSFCEQNKMSADDYLLSRKKAPLSYARLAQILSSIDNAKPKITARGLRYAAYRSLFNKAASEVALSHRSGLRNITKFHLFGALQENG